MNTESNPIEDYTLEEVALRAHLLHKAHPEPDVDKQLADFMEENGPSRSRGLHWGRWATALTAAAVLTCAFLLFRGKGNGLDVPEGAVVAYEAQREDVNRDITLQHGDEDARKVGKKVRAAVSGTANTTIMLNTLTTPSGITAEVVLADGTTVWLNADSRLTYPDRFTGNTREVTLEGEAYFKVSHDARHPFIVKAGQLSTRVLGTEFNVRSYKESDTHVTLIEGSVQVNTPHATQRIQPGEDAHFSGKSLLVERVDTETYTAWRNGEFYFDNETFLTIAQEIGKWYNVNVVFNNPDRMDTRLFFAAPKNVGIHEIAELLNSLGKGKVTWHDNQISID